jgi:hypothetical protein
MQAPKYQLWPALQPQPEDYARFMALIEREKAKPLPNHRWIAKAEADAAIAKSTGKDRC